ncbi:alpha/beta-hydrolase [Aspergillus steynii IBT 23096]|uniref:Alpha/beta-hydrolase n=1 Tax=Aspergillus steynii IBT 23096 TaxID=1392250 RepID=A0A2I2GAY8_9EURO|nr:alpha/beta-hydrolase [Aspergillus steynii IBT 23096]PLB50017.1 alpha/beta-hydrolase [Aspergillus steynii IBT 23096]
MHCLKASSPGVLHLGIALLAVGANATPLTKRTVQDWNEITPSSDLKWTPCFDEFLCTKLQVPLDYDNSDNTDTASLAFIKLPAEQNPDSAQSLVLNNGGPGASGISFLLSYTSNLRQAFGSQYNLVSFDPRGVNNSDLVVNCFRDDTAARQNFTTGFYGEVANASPSSLATHLSAVQLYGKWCSETLKENESAKYISTPAVAQDLLTFAKAEAKAAGKSDSDAKLWFYAMSYGTVIGSTFASLFPDHVGRLILDGVMDGEDYYNGEWRSHSKDSDAAILTFPEFCHQAGAEKCAFWGPSEKNITDRMDGLLANLKSKPPIGDKSTATYSDLIYSLTISSYGPLKMFPMLAQGMAALEKGDGSAIASMGSWLAAQSSNDARALISCVDTYGLASLTDLQSLTDYVSYLTGMSKYIGPAMAEIAPRALCSDLKLDLLAGPSFKGSLPPSSSNTAFPIMFASNTIDPVAPLAGAKKMSQAFANSILLTQNNVGHTAITAASNCYLEKIKEYLGGTVPDKDVACDWERIPFKDEIFISPM